MSAAAAAAAGVEDGDGDDRRRFELRGHGVPTQLLQDHVDFGRLVLHRYKARSCSFSLDGSVLDIGDDKKGDMSIVFRDECDESKMEVTWPLFRKGGDSCLDGNDDGDDGDDDGEETISNAENRMRLYLTVMDRISRRFNWLLNSEDIENVPIEFASPCNWFVKIESLSRPDFEIRSLLDSVSNASPRLYIEVSLAPFLIRTTLKGIDSKRLTENILTYEAVFNEISMER